MLYIVIICEMTFSRNVTIWKYVSADMSKMYEVEKQLMCNLIANLWHCIYIPCFYDLDQSQWHV